MEEIFPVNVITASDNPTNFKHKEMKLPLSFGLNDSLYVVSDYLDYSQTDGLLILHHDTILYERYYNGLTEGEDYISWSLAKSFVSALIGIAVQQGKINSINDPVDKYAKILFDSGYKGVSIKDVLQMSSGIEFNEDYHDYNSDINKLGRVFALGLSFDNYVSNLKSQRKAGNFHNYVSMDTQVLGMVLKGATGKSCSQYMEENLWKPMGAKYPATWLVDSDGMEAAFGGLNCTLEDYGRFAKMYADNGFANGKQIIDSMWVNASITANEPHLIPGDNPNSTHPFGYGYQWWIPEGNDGEYLGMGVYNQFLYVDPIHKIVIVKLSSNYHYATEKRATTFQHLELFRSIRSEILN